MPSVYAPSGSIKPETCMSYELRIAADQASIRIQINAWSMLRSRQ